MSFKRDGQKPPRPPPPKTKLGTGMTGISFSTIKALDEEDDEDLTIFTEKFDKVIEEAQKQQQLHSSSERKLPASEVKLVRTESASRMDSILTKLHAGSKSLDDGSASPTKRSLFEYKDLITGLKDKISDTKEKITDSISKKIEELSGDSSSNPSPENEHAVDSGEIIPQKAYRVSAEPKHSKHTTGDEIITNSGIDELQFLDCDDTAEMPTKNEEEEDDSIAVIDEYFSFDPHEDFSASPGLNVSLRHRSAVNHQLKKTSSTTVSMSTLLTSSPPEDEAIPLCGDNVSSNSSSMAKETIRIANRTVLQRPPTTMSNVKPVEKSVPVQKLLAVVVGVFAYLIIPLPSYLSGLVMGILLASLCWVIYIWYNQPRKPKEEFKLTPIDELPPMVIPEMKVPVKDDGIYKGWLNELMEYKEDDYHINQTHSVYVTLDGLHLRLQRPKVGVPKRAMWNETFPPAQFVHQRHFNLESSRIFLMPPGLVKKRIWSKKYPICIALAQHGTTSSNVKTPSTPDSEMGFEIVEEEKCDSAILYLFARTCREKEDWYKRFACATLGKPLPNHLLDLKRALSNVSKQKRRSFDSTLKHKRQESSESLPAMINSDVVESPSQAKQNEHLLEADLLGFAQYMGRLMPSAVSSETSSPGGKKREGKEENSWGTVSGSLICDTQLFWVNALIGRMFWDFLRDKWWSEKVTEKLQRKLSKIHVPYFIEELQVTDIDMGSEIPGIRRAGKPFIDEKGFWVDLDIAYSGGFRMTIETKVNLMKLKKESHQNLSQRNVAQRSAVTDSDEEDSAESSTDEEEEATTADDTSGGTASKKFLRYLDKITQSKYFQQATDNKYVKKAMEGVSNIPLILTVEVKSLVGTVAINLPPPPTDRLWYGFRTNPRLWLSAKPKVGEREVTFNYITEWIEKKLSIEFQRIFVMPNMDDLVIPILLAGLLPEALPEISSTCTTAV